MIKKLGFDNDFEYSGLKALERLKGSYDPLSLEMQITHVLTDLHMPQLNGLQFIKEAKKDERMKDVVFVVCTGGATPAEIDELYAAGAQQVMIKPISIRMLESILC